MSAYKILLPAFLAGCAPMPFAKIPPGDLGNLAYSVAQLIEYRRQSAWAEPETVQARGWGDCKGKAAVACAIIRTWPGFGAWYYYPNERHVVCRFIRFEDAAQGWIDDDIIWAR